jgi:hypothetical protein
MDPPNSHINYIDYGSVLVVNPVGRMRQLFVPFKVQVLEMTTMLHKSSWVYVEEIKLHEKHRLIYRIGNNWWPYHAFKIDIQF